MRSPVVSSPPLKAVLYGFNERARATLQMFFDGKGRECCEIVDGGDADIGIIDLDGVDASRAWSRFREQHGRPALVLSVTERDLPDSVWVHKPLNFDTLLAGIQELRRDYVEASSSRLNPAKQSHTGLVGGVPTVPEPVTAAVDTRVPVPQPAPDILQIASEAAVVVGNRPLVEQAIPIPVVVPDKAAVVGDTAVVPQHSDADDDYYRRDIHASYGDRDDSVYRDPGQNADVTYDPENYLQGVLARAMRLAREEGVAMRLSGVGQPLVVLPDRNALVTGMRDHYLRSLCIRATCPACADTMRCCGMSRFGLPVADCRAVSTPTMRCICCAGPISRDLPFRHMRYKLWRTGVLSLVRCAKRQRRFRFRCGQYMGCSVCATHSNL